MLVSISKAAEMVGVTRATFYRHIERKGITIIKDADDNPKVDVSELIRVYGDRVRQIGNTPTMSTIANDERSRAGGAHTDYDAQASEIEMLRERMRNLENDRHALEAERIRERSQLMEQIESLRHTLGESQEQHKRLTLLLTDQRSTKDGQGAFMAAASAASADAEIQKRKMDALEQTIQILKKQNLRIYQEIKANQVAQTRSTSVWERLWGKKKSKAS